MGTTYEILPGRGLGPVRFGMNPGEVEDRLGPQTGLEDWMGGNLNTSMLYPGALLTFDQSDSYSPLPDALLMSIDMQLTNRPHTLWEQPVAAWTRESLQTQAVKLGGDRDSGAEQATLFFRSLGLSLGLDAGGTPNRALVAPPWAFPEPIASGPHCTFCERGAVQPACREASIAAEDLPFLPAFIARNPSLMLEHSGGTIRIWDLELLGRAGSKLPFLWSLVRRGRRRVHQHRAQLLDAKLCPACGALQTDDDHAGSSASAAATNGG